MKTTQFCAILASLALLNIGYGAPGSFEFIDPIEPPAPPDNTPILLAADMIFQRIVQTQTTLIQHEATERQRKVAQAHALAFVKHLQRTTEPPPTPRIKRPGNTPGPEKPEKTVAVKTPRPPLPHYIAVDTEKSALTTPNAKKVVMLWDTQSESLVGNTAYDVMTTPPKIGATAKFDTYSAEYVGGGN